jgi:Flp pilus assembly protein TadD
MLKRVLIATAVACVALPAMAQTASTAQPSPPNAGGSAQQRSVAPPAAPGKPAPPPKPVKATPEQRAEAERLDPLARAAFWAREVDVDPRDNDARLKLAKALRGLGRFEEAAAAAEQILVVQPTNVEALLEAARDKISNNQGFYAVDDAQRAAALAPRDWRPVSLLAIAYEQVQRDADALAAHQRALSLAPNNPATLTNLGLYYATHNDPASAEPLLRKAAASPGAQAKERQNLALVLGLQGKFAEAESLQRQDLPPDQVNNNLAYLHGEATGSGAHSWDSLRAAAQ